MALLGKGRGGTSPGTTFKRVLNKGFSLFSVFKSQGKGISYRQKGFHFYFSPFPEIGGAIFLPFSSTSSFATAYNLTFYAYIQIFFVATASLNKCAASLALQESTHGLVK